MAIDIDWEYATIKMLRDEGITIVMLPDARARELIRLAGRIINRLTDQWFSPLIGSFQVDGRGTALAHLDNLIPIQVLERVDTGGVGQVELVEIDPTEFAWVRPKRVVELLGSKAHFPSAPLSTRLVGVFGWLEGLKEVETELTAGVASGAVTAAVLSTAGFRVGDHLLFEDQGQTVMVSTIPDGTTFGFDPVDFAVAVGKKVRTLGMPPREIQRAAMMLVMDRMGTLTEDADSDVADRIQSESTEGYSYSLGPRDAAATGATGGLPTSGNSAVDDILQGYVTPVLYYGVI